MSIINQTYFDKHGTVASNAIRAMGNNMTKDEQIKGMANPNRGSVGVQESRPQRTKLQVYCSQCGKISGLDEWDIHTCSPQTKEQK
jgi:hypothetical protein